MNFERITEKESLYSDLELKSTGEIVQEIHQENSKVNLAIEKRLSEITLLIDQIIIKLKQGGRLFYIGAGTSGRLGILDASECPPTFGVSHDLVIGLIAGGDQAIRKAVEGAEDSITLPIEDLKQYSFDDKDVLIGIAASGTTPYVVSALKYAKSIGAITGCITNNENTPLAQVSDFPIEVVIGPEYVTGSSRMKAGTVQKLVLNMISTSTMIRLGKVKGNKMVDLQLSNNKLIDRAIRILSEELKIPKSKAELLLREDKNVREIIENYSKTKS